MDWAEQDFVDAQWVAQCAHRLRDCWLQAPTTVLEETAEELWGNEALPAADAAESWLGRSTALK
jgi:hypothetical protein